MCPSELPLSNNLYAGFEMNEAVEDLFVYFCIGIQASSADGVQSPALLATFAFRLRLKPKRL
jgi:hypothetical protein